MFSIYKLAFLLVSLLASCAAAARSCRQCSGTLTIEFPRPVLRGVANIFVPSPLKGCATGGQYRVDNAHGENCVALADPTPCTKWVFDITAWRYCGNGGSVNKNGIPDCVDGLCPVSSVISMGCRKSVTCAAKCDSNTC